VLYRRKKLTFAISSPDEFLSISVVAFPWIFFAVGGCFNEHVVEEIHRLLAAMM